MILQSLPDLTSTTRLSSHILSIEVLRDFLAHITRIRSQAVDMHLLAAPGILSAAAGAGRGGSGSNNTSTAQQQWPAYVRARALQTVAAVSKKALGMALEQALAHGTDLRAAAAPQMQALKEIIHALLVGSGQSSQHEQIASSNVGLGLLRAMIEEFALTLIRVEDEGGSRPAAGAAGDSGNSRRDAKGKGRVIEQGSPVGLTATQHLLSKAAFQQYLYADSLNIVLHKLKDSLGPQATGLAPLFIPALSVLESLLSWSFLHHDIFAIVQSQSAQQHAGPDTSISSLDDSFLHQSQAFAEDHDNLSSTRSSRVPEELAEVLLSPGLLELVATAYRTAVLADGTDPSGTSGVALHRSRQCFSLALALTGDENQPSSSDLRRVATQLHLLSTLIREHTARGLLVAHATGLLFLAQAAKIFVSSTPASSILLSSSSSSSGSGEQPMLDFLNALAQLSHVIFNFAFARSRQTPEEDDLGALAEETTDALLSCWTSLVSSVRGELAICQDDHLSNLLHTVWNAVQQGLQTELVLPYIKGRMEGAAIVVEEDMSEQGEEAVKDRELYSDQLISIGLLARISAGDSLRALYELLHPRVTQALMSVPTDEAEAAALWEQLHWLFLVAGHVVADGATGETPTPPIDIVSLQNLGEEDAMIVARLLREIGVEAFARFAERPVHTASPQVMETWVWFTGRWAASYLLASSSASSGALSGDQGTMALTTVVNALSRVLQTWTGEADVILEIANTIKAIQLSETIPATLMETHELGTLLNAFMSAMPTIPSGTHGKLLSAVIGLIFAAPPQGQSMAEEYFRQITQHIRTRFETLAGSAEFQRDQQSAEAIFELQKVLDMLEGLAAAAQPRSARVILEFESTFFDAFNQLCRRYTGRAELVLLTLRIYTSLATALDFDLTSGDEMTRGFYRALWGYLEILRDDSESLGLLGNDIMEADELYEGLRLALDIIPILATYSSSSDMLQTNAHPATNGTSLIADSVEDVILFAFITLAPKVTEACLRTPSIAYSFSAACADVTRVCAQRILQLSAHGGHSGSELLGNVASALSKCCEADAIDVAMNALTGIKALATTSRRHLDGTTTPGTEAAGAPLRRLLFDVVRITLKMPLPTSLLDDYLLAIHALLLALLQPALGGEEQLRRSLAELCSRLSSGDGAQGHEAHQQQGGDVVEAVQTLFLAAQQHQPRVMVNGAEDGRSNGIHHNTTIRAHARMQAQAERTAANAFVKAVKPAVMRARATIRIR